MLLEINLVSSQSIYASAFTLVARSRVQVEDENQTLEVIASFLKNNIETLNAAIPDKDLINRLQNVEFTTISELYSLKFMMASFGIDVLFNSVAELEINPEGLEDDTIEYNVVDQLDDEPTFVRSASKLAVSANSGDLHSVYSKIIEGFGFFNTQLTEGFNNPLVSDLKVLKQSEDLMGVSPVAITMEINSIIEYLGKKIIAIMK